MPVPNSGAMTMNTLKRLLLLCCLGAMAILQAACEEEKMPIGVAGYDHVPGRAVPGFSIDEKISFDVAGHGCCVILPRKWRPGLKAKIDWVYYDGKLGERKPNAYSETVEIPEYRPDGADKLRLHFYPEHKVKVVMSRYDAGSPFYPMKKEELLPFKVDIYVVDRIRHEPHVFAKNATDRDWEWAKQWGLEKPKQFNKEQ
jgi:hypothetical protein